MHGRSAAAKPAPGRRRSSSVPVGLFSVPLLGARLSWVQRMTSARSVAPVGGERYTLDHTIGWLDLLGMSFLGGIGFTVALLVGELSYGGGTSTDDKVKVAVLLGSCTAAVIGGAILAARNRRDRSAASKPALRE